jgi:hypothetical protein
MVRDRLMKESEEKTTNPVDEGALGVLYVRYEDTIVSVRIDKEGGSTRGRTRRSNLRSLERKNGVSSTSDRGSGETRAYSLPHAEAYAQNS